MAAVVGRRVWPTTVSTAASRLAAVVAWDWVTGVEARRFR